MPLAFRSVPDWQRLRPFGVDEKDKGRGSLRSSQVQASCPASLLPHHPVAFFLQDQWLPLAGFFCLGSLLKYNIT